MKNKFYRFPVGAATTFAFFAIGMWTGQWGKAWVIFLLNPLLYWLIDRPKTEKEVPVSADKSTGKHEKDDSWGEF
ncbi:MULTISPECIES: hypothetical protein [unclassified Lactococcus]|uniref:hypothetical protein n=1 Tax=unclassified Lactococcus TaxID=2643510 RepID=UPI0011C973E0|nr:MULTISPECIES: hypothetical protein [unclassified Lactococcus]MQW22514.1 hypothetical protein [Lactococcus sp. dk101]TXK45538.1 hypothetical protein FVP42_00970 [Lactococcus sp. dk310]TXK51389.1 hypothetical protein FVP43_00975 [Lactococcus sp. dk322]